MSAVLSECVQRSRLRDWPESNSIAVLQETEDTRLKANNYLAIINQLDVTLKPKPYVKLLSKAPHNYTLLTRVKSSIWSDYVPLNKAL